MINQNFEMKNKYKNLDNKLKKLSEKQITTHASNEIIKYFPKGN